MWYASIEVAKFIITECFKRNLSISNLKLQKMLYFLWADFYRETGKWLFAEEVCAWQFGPVVPSVYYEYCSYAGRPIAEYYESNINFSDERILEKSILKYGTKTANELVAMTHRKGGAWDEIYQGGIGNRRVIPFDLIIKKEVG